MLQKILITAFFSILLLGCKNDDTRSCIDCTSPQTMQFEVCEESDGNASVNGENTGTPFELYIDDLIAAGASCGG